MRGAKITFVMVFVLALMLFAGPMVNAETLTFEKSATAGNVLNGAIDIVKVGGYVQGDYQYFYVETRTTGISQPINGGAYTLSISVEADVNGDDVTEYLDINLLWSNFNGTITHTFWYSVDSGQSTSKLTENEVTVSGTRVTVRVPTLVLQDVGVYNVEFITGEPKTYSEDQIIYYTPTSGDAGGNNDNGGDTGIPDESAPGWLPFMGLGVALACGIGFFIVWLLLALWAYKDAKKRCMSTPIIWFLIVFFLGIIGLIIYIVIRKDECQKQQPMDMPPPPPE